MRPTPTEILQGIKRMLTGVVEPLVKDEYASVQLGHAILALDDLARNWSDEVLWLLESGDVLEALLRDIGRTLDGASEDSALDDVANAVESALARAGTAKRHPTYEQLTERSDALREGLSAVVRAGVLERGDIEIACRVRRYLREEVARLS